jgi:hypothetical protein
VDLTIRDRPPARSDRARPEFTGLEADERIRIRLAFRLHRVTFHFLLAEQTDAAVGFHERDNGVAVVVLLYYAQVIRLHARHEADLAGEHVLFERRDLSCHLGEGEPGATVTSPCSKVLEYWERRTAVDGLSKMDIKKLVNRYIGVNGGYLGNFSYRTHADFYPEYCGLDIDPNQYKGTTRQRFETILGSSPPHVQAKIVRGIFHCYPPTDGDATMAMLHREFMELADRLEKDTSVSFVATSITSDVVERAINDAETLIRTQGATSGVDRLHTALHGYLRKTCEDAAIAYEDSASMTALFKRIKADHPAFQEDGPRAQDITQVMRAMSAIMDALNPLRNNASVAHPNETLLDEPEAMLAINATRTILHYLDAKVSKHRAVQAKKKPIPIAAFDDDIPF